MSQIFVSKKASISIDTSVLDPKEKKMLDLILSKYPSVYYDTIMKGENLHTPLYKSVEFSRYDFYDIFGKKVLDIDLSPFFKNLLKVKIASKIKKSERAVYPVIEEIRVFSKNTEYAAIFSDYFVGCAELFFCED